MSLKQDLGKERLRNLEPLRELGVEEPMIKPVGHLYSGQGFYQTLLYALRV